MAKKKTSNAKPAAAEHGNAKPAAAEHGKQPAETLAAAPPPLSPADDAVAQMAASQRGKFVELPMPHGLARFYALQPEQAVGFRQRLAEHWEQLGDLLNANEQELTKDQRLELGKLLGCCCRETPDKGKRPRLLFPGSKGRQHLAHRLPPGDLVRLGSAVATFNRLLPPGQVAE